MLHFWWRRLRYPQTRVPVETSHYRNAIIEKLWVSRTSFRSFWKWNGKTSSMVQKWSSYLPEDNVFRFLQRTVKTLRLLNQMNCKQSIRKVILWSDIMSLKFSTKAMLLLCGLQIPMYRCIFSRSVWNEYFQLHLDTGMRMGYGGPCGNEFCWELKPKLSCMGPQ